MPKIEEKYLKGKIKAFEKQAMNKCKNRFLLSYFKSLPKITLHKFLNVLKENPSIFLF